MKFFIHFFSTLVILFFVWSTLIIFQSGNPTLSSQWVYDAYQKKERIANSINGKKIVVVAGSNVLFGVDSKLLSKAFKLPVVNYGVNAGIELPYILYISKKIIKKGDIVLLPLEYPMYSYKGETSQQMIDYVLSREPSFFWKLSLKEQFYMVWHIGFERIYHGYFYQGGKPITEGLYGAHHIDQYGDQNETEIGYRTEWMQKDILNNYAINAERYGEEFNENSLGWQYLQFFIDWCHVKGATTIFMPSTLMQHPNYLKNKKERWFYENIANEIKKEGWRFIGKPYDYMYDKEDYFNTNFHLIDRARKKRTQQMILDLQ